MHKNAPEPLKWERDFIYTTGEFSAPTMDCFSCRAKVQSNIKSLITTNTNMDTVKSAV